MEDFLESWGEENQSVCHNKTILATTPNYKSLPLTKNQREKVHRCSKKPTVFQSKHWRARSSYFNMAVLWRHYFRFQMSTKNTCIRFRARYVMTSMGKPPLPVLSMWLTFRGFLITSFVSTAAIFHEHVAMSAKQLFAKVQRRYPLLQSFTLKKEQEEVPNELLNKKHVFSILPTGYGKTLIFSLFPLLLDVVSLHVLSITYIKCMQLCM